MNKSIIRNCILIIALATLYALAGCSTNGDSTGDSFMPGPAAAMRVSPGSTPSPDPEDGISSFDMVDLGIAPAPEEVQTRLRVEDEGSRAVGSQGRGALCLSIQFAPQVPPGSWSATMSCGPASLGMASAFLNKTTLNQEACIRMINTSIGKTDINNCLPGGSSCDDLVRAAQSVCDLKNTYKGSGWTLDALKVQMNRGIPVIAAGRAGKLPNRGDAYTGAHFPEGCEEVGRTTLVPWSLTIRNGLYYGVHTGLNDCRIYPSSRPFTGPWGSWDTPFPDCATNLPVSMVTWRYRIVYAFTGGDGKIWVGWTNSDSSGWSGWYFTNRTTSHGPSLASDGDNLWLVHKGDSNNRIYYSLISGSGPTLIFSNPWIDTGRDTTERPACAALRNQLYIAHKGSTNNEIYYANESESTVQRKITGRSSMKAPSIAIIDRAPVSEVWIAHQGLNDNKNYLGKPDSSLWVTLKDTTDVEPFIKAHDTKIVYCYVNQNRIRLQYYQP